MPTNGTPELLLVTHDSGQVERLGRALAERGYAVVTAANGAAGLLAAHAERPALILLEAEMPVLNGYQMLEGLRSDPATREIPSILLLPPDSEDDTARGWLCGADFCLPRDASSGDLLLAIDRTLLVGGTISYSLA
jgi:DNA-binding response OmpR family regulator